MVKRYPVQIDNWKVTSGKYSHEGLLLLIQEVVSKVLAQCEKPGIFLSGGVDSSLLAIIANSFCKVPCFTIGGSFDHPDVVAATKLAKEFDFELYIYLPSSTQEKLATCQVEGFPGDEGVFLALQFASRFIDGLLATDGIDEQMGGYWWHIHRNSKFPKPEMAFEHFWNELEPAHLIPMFESAKRTGTNIHWIFLYPEIVDYISRISLEERVKDGIGKVFWREVARKAGVPEWVINREKRGFVNALDGLSSAKDFEKV